MGKKEKKRVSHEMDAEKLKYYKSEEFLEKTGSRNFTHAVDKAMKLLDKVSNQNNEGNN